MRAGAAWAMAVSRLASQPFLGGSTTTTSGRIPWSSSWGKISSQAPTWNCALAIRCAGRFPGHSPPPGRRSPPHRPGPRAEPASGDGAHAAVSVKNHLAAGQLRRPQRLTVEHLGLPGVDLEKSVGRDGKDSPSMRSQMTSAPQRVILRRPSTTLVGSGCTFWMTLVRPGTASRKPASRPSKPGSGDTGSGDQHHHHLPGLRATRTIRWRSSPRQVRSSSTAGRSRSR